MSLKEPKLQNQELHELEGAGGSVLAEHTAAIKMLGKRVLADVIEIGRRLVDCRDNHLKHGEYLPWLAREFGWSRQSADNFIHVYEAAAQGKLPNVGNLNLPVSSLYLLAAPGTPDEARTAIMERAQAGEILPAAEIKQTIVEAKVRKARNLEHPKIFREMKLGADTVAALEGTTLASAREQDELVFLNRGASEGELTEIVRDLVACALRGEKVSAIEYSGAAYRREKVSVSEIPQQREAIAERIRDLLPNTVDPKIASRNASAEQGRLRHFEFQNIALRSEIEELKAQVQGLEKPVGSGGQPAPKTTKAVKTGSQQLNSLAWSNASPDERARFLNTIGKSAVLAAAPPGWNLDEESVLRAAAVEKLIGELRRRAPAQLAKRLTPDRGGPVLDLEPAVSVADDDEISRTTH